MAVIDLNTEFSNSAGPPLKGIATLKQPGLSFLRCALRDSRGRANPPYRARVVRMRGLPAGVGAFFTVTEELKFPHD